MTYAYDVPLQRGVAPCHDQTEINPSNDPCCANIGKVKEGREIKGLTDLEGKRSAEDKLQAPRHLVAFGQLNNTTSASSIILIHESIGGLSDINEQALASKSITGIERLGCITKICTSELPTPCGPFRARESRPQLACSAWTWMVHGPEAQATALEGE